jgi:autotransporter-associated beta strand protein/T5SS/PEP-CTERM-associated repeat protein
MMRIKLTLLCLVLATLCANVQAADDFWNTTIDHSNFSLPANWSLGTFPATTDIARIDNGAIVDVLSAPPSPITMGQLWIGSTLPTDLVPGVGTLNDSAYQIVANNYVVVGEGYTLSTLNTPPDATNNIAGGTGTLNLSGTAKFYHISAGYFNVGENSDSGSTATTTGYVNLSGSAVLNNYYGRFILGKGANGIGYLHIQDTAILNLNDGEFDNIGFVNGVGIVTQDGGTVNKIGSNFLLVGGWGGTGTWNLNGGTLNSTSNPLVMGDGESGSTSKGYFYLNTGGLLNTVGVQAGLSWDTTACTGNFYFNGGTLQASASSTNFMSNANGTAAMNVYVSTNGAKINTNNFNITIAQQLSTAPTLTTDGGLTKLGSGTLTLTSYLQFLGNISVNAGTLLVTSTINTSPTATVASGATLGGGRNGYQCFNDVVVSAPVSGVRGIISPGDPATDNGSGAGIGTMSMNNLTITAAALNFQINPANSSDQINLGTYTLTASSSGSYKNLFNFTLLSAGSATSPPYTIQLIKYGTFTGSINDFALADDSLGSFDAALANNTTTDSIDLVLTASNEWQGTTNTYTTTTNWKTGSVPKNQGNKAVFASLGSIRSVNLDISPILGKLIFNNGSDSYTIDSTTSQSITLDTTVVAGPQVLSYAGSHLIKVNVAMNQNTLFNVDDDTLYSPSTVDTLTLSGVLSGPTQSITKTGSGNLVLSNANTYGGSTTVSGGTLELDGSNTYTGPTTVTNAALIAKSIAATGVSSSIGAPTSTDPSYLALNTSTLTYTGTTAVTTDRGITLANAVTIDTVKDLTFNGPAVMGGSGVTLNTPSAGMITLGGQITSAPVPFTKTGPGTLTYTSASGVINTISQGGGIAYTILNGSVIIAGADNTTEYDVPNGELTVGWNSENHPVSLTVSGGTVNVGQWFSVGTGNQLTSTLTMTGGAINAQHVSIGFASGNATGGTQVVSLSGNSSVNASLTNFWIGESAGCHTTVGLNDNAQMSSGAFMSIGLNGTATVTVNGPGATLSTVTDLNVGDGATANGTLNLQNGAVQTSVLWVGKTSGAVGLVTQSGGTLTAATDFRIGDGSTGTYNQTGGTVTASYLRMAVVATGSGTYNLSAGTANFTTTGIQDADIGSLGTGTLNVSGTGSISVPPLYLGCSYWTVTTPTTDGGTGNITVSGGGSLTVTGNIIGSSNTGTGNINLNGGTLTTTGIGKAAAPGTGGILNVYFNGGVLKAGASDNPTGGTYFITGLTVANVQSSGAIIDTNNFNVTINQILAADTGSPGGGLTKVGSGTLTLSTVNTYTGGTIINAGTLSVATNLNLGAAAGRVVINGGTLKVATGSTGLIMARPLSVGPSSGVAACGVYPAEFQGSSNTGWLGGTLDVTGGSGSHLAFKRTAGSTTTVSGSPIIEINAGATVQLGGTVAATYDPVSGLAVSIVNYSTLDVTGTNQRVGAITGSGSTFVDSGANLTASSIVQDTLTIGSGPTLAFDPSISDGSTSGSSFSAASSSSLTAVPEPGSLVLLAMAVLAAAFAAWSRKKH